MLNKQSNNLLKQIPLAVIRLPVLLLILSIIFTIFSYADNVFGLSQWKHIFDITETLGNIFFLLAVATFIFQILNVLFLRYERKMADQHKITSLVLMSARKGFRIIFILATLSIAITLIAPAKNYFEIANNVIYAVTIAAIGWVAIQVLYTIEMSIYQKMQTLTDEELQRTKMLYTKMRIIRNIATVVIIILTIASILMSFNSVRTLGVSLLASAGFLTAIVGLSAQKTLISLFSGLQLVFSQAIKIGDIVVIDNQSGIVEEITFTYVVLKLGDRKRLLIPINYFITKPYENWSREGNSLRSSFLIYVDFLMPIEPLRKELDNILAKSTYWDGAAKKLHVNDLNNQAVEIRIQISAANADNLSDLRTEVKEKMLTFIQENYPDHFPQTRNVEIQTT